MTLISIRRWDFHVYTNPIHLVYCTRTYNIHHIKFSSTEREVNRGFGDSRQLFCQAFDEILFYLKVQKRMLPPLGELVTLESVLVTLSDVLDLTRSLQSQDPCYLALLHKLQSLQPLLGAVQCSHLVSTEPGAFQTVLTDLKCTFVEVQTLVREYRHSSISNRLLGFDLYSNRFMSLNLQLDSDVYQLIVSKLPVHPVYGEGPQSTTELNEPYMQQLRTLQKHNLGAFRKRARQQARRSKSELIHPDDRNY